MEKFVLVCIGFKPKAISLLKDAAAVVTLSIQRQTSRVWFEKILAGLELSEWPGSELHRRLMDSGVFDKMDNLINDGRDLLPEAPNQYDTLRDYFDAIWEDDFPQSAQHLTKLKQILN